MRIGILAASSIINRATTQYSSSSSSSLTPRQWFVFLLATSISCFCKCFFFFFFYSLSSFFFPLYLGPNLILHREDQKDACQKWSDLKRGTRKKRVHESDIWRISLARRFDRSSPRLSYQKPFLPVACRPVVDRPASADSDPPKVLPFFPPLPSLN